MNYTNADPFLGDNSFAMLDPFGKVPDVVDCQFAQTDDAAWLAFNFPRKRSERMYVESSWWSGSGINNLIAGSVNDKSITAPAFSWPSTPVSLLDEYSDNGTSWTTASVPTSGLQSVLDFHGYRTVIRPWNDAGAHRYWCVASGSARIIYDAGAGNTRAFREVWYSYNIADPTIVTQVWFRELGDVFMDEAINAFVVYDESRGAREIYVPIVPQKIPTPLNPVILTPIRRATPATIDADGFYTLRASITVVTGAGAESIGLSVDTTAPLGPALRRTDFVNQSQATITLLNGLNSDVAIANGPRLVVSSNPTAPHSVDGFDATGFTGGERFRLYNNTSQPLTVVQEGAGSLANNRIKFNATILGPGWAEFERVGSPVNRWLYLFGRDAAGLK